MDPEIKALDAKVVLALPVGSPLVLSWYEDGARLASAQIAATEANALVLNVWRSGALGLGNQPEVWNLKADGRFLVDSPKHFRCSLRLPSEREMESFKTHLKKFPVPAIPLEGALVKIHYDVDPLECDLPEAVGTVAIQRFDEMRVDLCYYSMKQQKIVNEPIRLDRADSRWMDREAATDCVLTVIDRGKFDSWLAEDEKVQKRKAAPAMAPAAAVSKPAGKVLPTKKRKAAKS
jgi:hypothetical protein